MNAWTRMNKRERALAAVVAVVLGLLLNLILFNFIFKKRTQLQADLGNRKAEIESLELLFAERDLWTARGQWIKEHQPAIGNESTAGVELHDEVKKLAQDAGVTLTNVSFATPFASADYRSVSLIFETKCSWESLIKFLHALQQPGRFVGFESTALKIDAQDQSKIHGRFKVGKWYAP
jgi:hypothetical protein